MHPPRSPMRLQLAPRMILVPLLLMACGQPISVAEVDPPPTTTEATQALPPGPQVLVSTEGLVLIDASGVRTNLACAAPCRSPEHLDLEGLTTALEAAREHSGDATLTLRATEEIPHGLIMAVMEASRQADFPIMVLAEE